MGGSWGGYRSTKASPPNIIPKNSDGSSVVARKSVFLAPERTSRGKLTEARVWHGPRLSIHVVLLAQVVVAQDLIRFTDLW